MAKLRKGPPKGFKNPPGGFIGASSGNLTSSFASPPTVTLPRQGGEE